MQTIATSTIPQEVPLSALVPSPTNPRQHFYFEVSEDRRLCPPDE